jgi:long-chain fatty acid transport protein
VSHASRRQLEQNSLSARTHRSAVWISLAAAGCLTAGATDGYFSDGYGMKAKGRAGVSLTESDDAFGGANNPATLARAVNRVDVGVDWFRPERSAERTGPALPLNGSVTSDRDNFFIPELGFKYSLNPDWALGLTVYGNGGMNTFYPAGQLNLGPGASGLNLLAGRGELGVDLSQMLIAPTVAWQFATDHAVGLSPIIAYQRFKAYGLSAFAPLSQDPGALTDQGVDESWGAGVRVGYLWNVTETVALGAQYSSPVFCERFEKYRGLFAGDGSFDIPQSVGVGLGWQALPQLHLGVDYKWIDYASVDPVGNSSSNAGLLGQSSGPGFGWESISVVKVGADWKVAEHWTLRAGYSFNENPVPSSDVTFNIVAPGVIQHHVTGGLTFAFGRHEITAAYMHGFENSVTGQSKFVALGMAPPGTQEEITMAQNSFGLAYSFKF